MVPGKFLGSQMVWHQISVRRMLYATSSYLILMVQQLVEINLLFQFFLKKGCGVRRYCRGQTAKRFGLKEAGFSVSTWTDSRTRSRPRSFSFFRRLGPYL